MVKILHKDLWKNIVMNMPIPAKDLLFYCDKKGLLMGRRINKPAKDYYFVPGGRVFKNENRSNAIKRIAKEEVGYLFNNDKFSSIGIYDHFYLDSIWENTEISTHYIVEAILIVIENDEIKFSLANQHSEIIWINELNIEKVKVHEYSKQYLYDILKLRKAL